MMGKPQITNNIKDLIRRKGTNEKFICYRTNVTPQTLERWKKNDHQPNSNVILILAELFNVPVEEIIQQVQ